MLLMQAISLALQTYPFAAGTRSLYRLPRGVQEFHRPYRGMKRVSKVPAVPGKFNREITGSGRDFEHSRSG